MGDRKAIELRKKRNAARQREIREARDAGGLCRTCGDPAVVSERTGRLAKQCAEHLAYDIVRKDVYVLAYETDYPSGKAIESRLEFPLGPLL